MSHPEFLVYFYFSTYPVVKKMKRKQMFDGGCNFRWYNQIEIAKDS